MLYSSGLVPASIVAGLVNPTNETDSRSAARVNVKCAIVHPKFSHTSPDNDIGILILEKPLGLPIWNQKENMHANTICLPAANRTFSSKEFPLVSASGLGMISENSKPHNKLQYADFQIYPHQKCCEDYELDDPRYICAGSEISGTCQVGITFQNEDDVQINQLFCYTKLSLF